MQIVGSGSLNLDLFYEVEDLREIETVKLSPGGECWGSRKEFEKLREELEKRGRFITQCGGGSAANTIYALKKWGFKTGFIGLVGDDPEGEEILKELRGTNLSRVRRIGKSACCLIVLDAQKDRAIFVSPHSKEEALKEFEANTTSEEWLHLSSLVSEEGLSFHLRLKKTHQGPSSIDPGEIYARKGLKIRPLLEGHRILFLTAQELSFLGIPLEDLSGKVKLFFLKQGQKGAILWDGKKYEIPPVSPEKTKDNTGAGDVFNAGVIAGLLSGLSPLAAGKLGSHLAALSLRDYGRLGYPEEKEFEYWRQFYGST